VKQKQGGRSTPELTKRAGRTIFLAARRSPLGWFVRHPLVQRIIGPPVERIKSRFCYIPAWRVLALLDLLAAADVQVWVAGGWGVDALLGRQTRRHADVDFVIGDDGPPYEQAAHVLAREGFRFGGASLTPGIPIPWCHAWFNLRHKVEVLPVRLLDEPFATDAVDGMQPFTVGSIDGRPVPCLSADLQLLLHSGYRERDKDGHDVPLLRTLATSPRRMTTT
jgi:lincosamide nucleotidyltransferase A/C/D/E